MTSRTRDPNYWGEMNSLRQVFLQGRTTEVTADSTSTRGLRFDEEFWLEAISYPERLRAASDCGQPALLTPLPVVREWTKKIRPTPSSLQRGHYHGRTARDYHRVLVMG